MFCTTSLFAQTQYEYFESDRLGARELKIQLPRNYDKNPEKFYPLILVARISIARTATGSIPTGFAIINMKLVTKVSERIAFDLLMRIH